MEDAQQTGNLIASEKVEGTSVYNTAGDNLGAIHDLMIDKATGKVAYQPSKKLVRPRVTPFEEDSAPVGCARIFVEVDAGTGQGVEFSIDLEVSVHAYKERAASAGSAHR